MPVDTEHMASPNQDIGPGSLGYKDSVVAQFDSGVPIETSATYLPGVGEVHSYPGADSRWSAKVNSASSSWAKCRVKMASKPYNVARRSSIWSA